MSLTVPRLHLNYGQILKLAEETYKNITQLQMDMIPEKFKSSTQVDERAITGKGNSKPENVDSLLENRTQKENRVVSMSLYGSDPRYTKGAIANSKIIRDVFPGWKLRIYLPLMDNTLSPRSKMAVPLELVYPLRAEGVQLVFIDPVTHPVKNGRMWRFLVANDQKVDRFIVRESDAKLIPRDAIEVKRWIQSGEAFQCMRDHPAHSNTAVMAGMWGAVRGKLFQYLPNNTFSSKQLSKYSTGYFEDQNFLRDKVWPYVKHHAFCSDSFSWRKWESSHPFATERNPDDFVGTVWWALGGRGIYENNITLPSDNYT